MIIQTRPFTIAELKTPEGRRELMEQCFPECPSIGAYAESLYAASKAAISEAEWFASIADDSDSQGTASGS